MSEGLVNASTNRIGEVDRAIRRHEEHAAEVESRTDVVGVAKEMAPPCGKSAPRAISRRRNETTRSYDAAMGRKVTRS